MAGAGCLKGEGVHDKGRTLFSWVSLLFGGFLTCRVAADKTSKQLTDTINRGGSSTMAEAVGRVRGTLWG